MMQTKVGINSIRMSKLPITVSLIILVLLLVPCGVFAAGKTTRVNVSSTGEQSINVGWEAYDPSISANGRYVAFSSEADNLVAGDSNGAEDVFIHDRQTGQTTRVSVNSDGVQGDGNSDDPSISADGWTVAFKSRARNLMPLEHHNSSDVYVHDRRTGQTRLASQSSSGEQGNHASASPSISGDGRYVAYSSTASNLVAGDTNNAADAFVHDLLTGQTSRVSVSSKGDQANYVSGFYMSFSPSISSDGRFVAFHSSADNLVPGDSNDEVNVFVHDRQTGQTKRVSVSSAGVQGNGESRDPSISADGRYVAFESEASNLVSGDNNGVTDVFVHDRQSGQTIRVSVSSSGVQGNGSSDRASISSDGRHVTFVSSAENLVGDDSNGIEDVFVHDHLYSPEVDTFITRFYSLCLDRVPDQNGLTYWTNSLIFRSRTGADVAKGFIFSQEFLNKNVSDEDYLDILYEAFFNRLADAGGYNSWLSELKSGVERGGVLDGFIYSQEFANLCDEYDIIPFPAADPVEAFVTRFYEQCLGREPDQGGLDHWVNSLKDGSRTGADVAYGFVFSQEFLNLQTSYEDYLRVLYKAFFNRDPDDGGWNDWLEMLNSGVSREEVLNGFIYAQEFFNLCNEFGIIPN